MGTPYTGIIYSATDDIGKVVSPPIKSARFGKRFGNTGLSERMLRHTQDFKEGTLMWYSEGTIPDVSTVSHS